MVVSLGDSFCPALAMLVCSVVPLREFWGKRAVITRKYVFYVLTKYVTIPTLLVCLRSEGNVHNNLGFGYETFWGEVYG